MIPTFSWMKIGFNLLLLIAVSGCALDPKITYTPRAPAATREDRALKETALPESARQLIQELHSDKMKEASADFRNERVINRKIEVFIEKNAKSLDPLVVLHLMNFELIYYSGSAEEEARRRDRDGANCFKDIGSEDCSYTRASTFARINARLVEKDIYKDLTIEKAAFAADYMTPNSAYQFLIKFSKTHLKNMSFVDAQKTAAAFERRAYPKDLVDEASVEVDQLIDIEQNYLSPHRAGARAGFEAKTSGIDFWRLYFAEHKEKLTPKEYLSVVGEMTFPVNEVRATYPQFAAKAQDRDGFLTDLIDHLRDLKNATPAYSRIDVWLNSGYVPEENRHRLKLRKQRYEALIKEITAAQEQKRSTASSH